MGIFGWSYPPGAADDPFAPYNDTSGDCEDQIGVKLTKSQKAKIKRIRAGIIGAQEAPVKRPIPTFAEVWQSLSFLFDGKTTRYEEDTGGDWDVIRCDSEDCPHDWHKFCHRFIYDSQGEVMEGKKGATIEVESCDEDGNWEFDNATYDGDPYWEDFYQDYFLHDAHFIGWAEYHIWCAENGGIDPLEEFFQTKDSTIDGHIKAAQDNLKYLRMGRGK